MDDLHISIDNYGLTFLKTENFRCTVNHIGSSVYGKMLNDFIMMERLIKIYLGPTKCHRATQPPSLSRLSCNELTS